MSHVCHLLGTFHSFCLAHVCRQPAAFVMSSFRSVITAFDIILLDASPIPIGLTPWHLFKGISQHASNALTPMGLTGMVEIFLATHARAWHRLSDTCL